MKIQDLEMMEILTIDPLKVDRVQGGIGFSFLRTAIGLDSIDAMSWKSLYEVLDNGFTSISVLSVVAESPDGMMSFASSSSTISIG
jgi:hypothetical protein